MNIEARGTTRPQRGGDLKLTTRTRWVRLAVYIDPPPRMSHIGFWRTGWGDLRGWNLRFKVPGRYVTCLAHTRPARDANWLRSQAS